MAENAIITRSATDISEAEAYLTNAFCSHRLEPEGASRLLDFRHRAVEVGRSAFNLLQYGEAVSIEAGGFENFYMLEMPLAGGVDIEFGSERFRSGVGTALLLSPGPRFRSYWREGTRQWMLQLDRSLVEGRLAALSRRPVPSAPVFRPVIELSSRHGRALNRIFAAFSATLASPPGATEPDADGRLLGQLVDLLLRDLPYVHGASIVPERLHATPRHVKRAFDLLKAHYADRLSMPAIAREVGVSERALYEGFQRYYQQTPYGILTRIRLDAARRLLREEGVAVAEAARRVGIGHLGRFSASYREAFGVLPSQDARERH